MYGRIGSKACFLGEHGYCLLQFCLDEIEYSLRLHLSLSIHRHVIVANSKWYIAEGIKQSDVKPCAQHPALCLEIVKLSLRETELLRRERIKVFNDIIGLHDALEASVPFCLGIASILHVPLMIVQATPFASVVPPSVTGGSDELVGRQFVEHVPALYAPESMFKWAEGGTHDIHLRIIVVLCAHLVVKSLVEVCTTRKCGCT